METVIGLCSFICGFFFMLAIHMILMDIYKHRHEECIRKLENRQKNRLQIDVTEHHTFANAGDVSDLKFNE